MSLLPKSIHRCRRYPTKFNSGRDIPSRGETEAKAEEERGSTSFLVNEAVLLHEPGAVDPRAATPGWKCFLDPRKSVEPSWI